MDFDFTDANLEITLCLILMMKRLTLLWLTLNRLSLDLRYHLYSVTLIPCSSPSFNLSTRDVSE